MNHKLLYISLLRFQLNVWNVNCFISEMKKICKIITALAFCAMVPSGWAIAFNQNITAIFGTGNPDTGWTTDTSAGGIQLGLRAKDRDTASTANASGVYSYATGFAVSNPARARWNWEFSINSGGVNLDNFDFYISVDTDPSQATSYTTVNALTFFADNSYGNNATANGAGVEGPAAALASGNNIAQQSQNLVFVGGNPNLDATYDYVLYAVAPGAGSGGAHLAETRITVVVGNGGAVPDTGSTLALLGLGIAALTGFSYRQRMRTVCS